MALEAANGAERRRTSLGASTGSSPAIKDGLVVVGSSDNAVSAFSLDAGQSSWSYDFGPPSEGLFTVTNGVVAAPALSGGLAYVGSTNRKVAAIDLTSGEATWETDLLAPIYASVSVGDNVYLSTAGGTAVALDHATGSVVWEVELGEPSYSSTLLIDDALVVTTEAGIVFGLDPGTGQELWRVTVGVDGDFMASTPTFTSTGLLVLGANDGRVVALQKG